MTASPRTLTAKIVISTISGARIRRRTRKTVSDACAADAAAARVDARRARRWFLFTPVRSAAVEGDGVHHEEHDGDDVGQQRTAGERDDAGRPAGGEAGRGDVDRVAVEQRGADQLEVGHE